MSLEHIILGKTEAKRCMLSRRRVKVRKRIFSFLLVVLMVLAVVSGFATPCLPTVKAQETQEIPPDEILREGVPIVQKGNDLVVTWVLVKQAPFIINVSVQNLIPKTRTVNITAIIDNLSFSAEELEVEIYEWKNISYTVGNTTYYKLDWKPCKMQSIKRTAKEFRANMELITLPPFGSKEKDGTYNGTKWFRIVLKTPMRLGFRIRGRVALDIDGAIFDPWFDTSWQYRRPITITERSGNTLSDYQVRIELNSTNFDDWDKVRSDGGDIRFTDSDELTLLNYWIEYFNVTEQKAFIWVKVPQIPANEETTIYMYYGNPTATSESNGDAVFIFFDDFEDGVIDTSKWDVGTGGTVEEVGGELHIYGTSIFTDWIGVRSASFTINPVTDKVAIRAIGVKRVDGAGTSDWFSHIVVYYDDNNMFDVDLKEEPDPVFRSRKCVGGTWTTIGKAGTWSFNTRYTLELVVLAGTIKGYYDGNLIATGSYQVNQPHKVGIFKWDGLPSSGYELNEYVDAFLVRKYVEPEPSVSVGAKELVRAIKLPSTSLLLQHDLAYNPNSTQFTHSLTVANTVTAGYETNYTSPYGWRVYANPFDSTENNATLVSEVNITLPYTSVLAENVTLLAKTNGTGSFRQLWIKVLDGTGNVVAELTNATLGTDWTEVVLTVNANLSEQATIWINATVGTTTDVGEEIGVKDVTLYVRHEENPIFKVPRIFNKDFNCSATFFVELGDTDKLNVSVIRFKLVEFLIYNATDYPIEPIYEGDEIIGSYLYRVYRIEPANYSQTTTIYAVLENKFKTFTTRVKSYVTDTVLIGEAVTIELPEIGNITISNLNLTFINVTSVTVKFNATGTYIIEANRSRVDIWSLGLGSKVITVKYGSFEVNVLDLDFKAVDYEDLALQLVDKAKGITVREATGRAQFTLDNLWASNYTVLIKFKDIIVGTRDFELNITTDASAVPMNLTMKKFATDYRGKVRTMALDYTKNLLVAESLSNKFPYSRMRILINGTGIFKIYLNYMGDLPTKVKIEGNVTNLKYYWDDNYLVITGSLGSIGELNITDLYKFRLELYDRLGNLMPCLLYTSPSPRDLSTSRMPSSA